MNVADNVELSWSNLHTMKLRTTLTVTGVMVAVGALVSMMSFGLGMQKNITDSFNSMELFNSITVLPDALARDATDPGRAARVEGSAARRRAKPLDDGAIAAISSLPGVDVVFPDVRFPATIRFNGEEDFKLVQVVPARVATSTLFRVVAGRPFHDDRERAVIVSRGLLHQFKVEDPERAVGQTIDVASITFDPALLLPMNWPALMQGGGMQMEHHGYVIAGVTGGPGMGAPSPIQSDVYIPAGTAAEVSRLPFTSVWDLFRLGRRGPGYSALNVRLSSPAYVDPVKSAVKDMGYSCIALADQFREIRTAFLYMDMFLSAVAMIGISIATLGIANTMVMSILERYSEIGIMKAVGASDGDIRKIFFVEASVIGFLGGLSGLALGWAVSRLINLVINYFLAKQGVPYLDYFDLTPWLASGAILFSVAISLIAGIYPALRAARIDPVAALRHK